MEKTTLVESVLDQIKVNVQMHADNSDKTTNAAALGGLSALCLALTHSSFQLSEEKLFVLDELEKIKNSIPRHSARAVVFALLITTIASIRKK